MSYYLSPTGEAIRGCCLDVITGTWSNLKPVLRGISDLCRSFWDGITSDAQNLASGIKGLAPAIIMSVTSHGQANGNNIVSAEPCPNIISWHEIDKRLEEDPNHFSSQMKPCLGRYKSGVEMVIRQFSPFDHGKGETIYDPTKDYFRNLGAAASNMILPGYTTNRPVLQHAGIKFMTLAYMPVDKSSCDYYKEAVLSQLPHGDKHGSVHAYQPDLIVDALWQIDLPASKFDAGFLALASMTGYRGFNDQLACLFSADLPPAFHPALVIKSLTGSYEGLFNGDYPEAEVFKWNISYFEDVYGTQALHDSILVTVYEAIRKLRFVDKDAEKRKKEEETTFEKLRKSLGMGGVAAQDELLKRVAKLQAYYDASANARILDLESVKEAIKLLEADKDIARLFYDTGTNLDNIVVRGGRPPMKKGKDVERDESRTALQEVSSGLVDTLPKVMAVFTYGYLHLIKNKAYSLAEDGSGKGRRIDPKTEKHQLNLDTGIVFMEAIQALSSSSFGPHGFHFYEYFQAGTHAVLASYHDDPETRSYHRKEAGKRGVKMSKYQQKKNELIESDDDLEEVSSDSEDMAFHEEL